MEKPKPIMKHHVISQKDNYSEETLIVTSTVRSQDPHLTIKDKNTRLYQLFCSMICWIKDSKIKNIILCDNSCLQEVFFPLNELAKEHNKNIEILTFHGDHQKVILYGKGFGEGEIIRYILQNSLLLKGKRTFFKITGRVFVENFDEIMDAEKTKKTVFDLRTRLWKKAGWHIIAQLPFAEAINNRSIGYISTVFYKCSLSYYREHLIDCHAKVSDLYDLGLERRMFLPLMKNGFKTFQVKPRLIGQCAGTGLSYGTTIDFPPSVSEKAREMVGASCL